MADASSDVLPGLPAMLSGALPPDTCTQYSCLFCNFFAASVFYCSYVSGTSPIDKPVLDPAYPCAKRTATLCSYMYGMFAHAEHTQVIDLLQVHVRQRNWFAMSYNRF